MRVAGGQAKVESSNELEAAADKLNCNEAVVERLYGNVSANIVIQDSRLASYLDSESADEISGLSDRSPLLHGTSGTSLNRRIVS